MTTLPTSDLAYELTQAWLARYEQRELDAVDVIYNAYRRAGVYQPLVFHLLPPALSSEAAKAAPWPPPYIDTDPVALYTRLAVLWMTTELYRILLDSAAAEHSARFQLMEGATQNSTRLINELTLALQSARQQAITSEMQELAAGAGLLSGQEE
jgi:F-type H+-transporting ATPase subunit gamma